MMVCFGILPYDFVKTEDNKLVKEGNASESGLSRDKIGISDYVTEFTKE